MRRPVMLLFAILVGVPAALLLAGQLNLFAGARPTDLGARDGMLKPPGAASRNVVSSQADLHPHEERHRIAPLRFNGDPAIAFARLERVVRAMDGASVVTAGPAYLHAEYRTRLMRFIDDAEFLLDAPNGVIHMRSASRVGRGDLGANRARLEAVKAAFDAG